MAIPTSGTYQLQVGELSATPTTGQSPGGIKLSSVTFGVGYVIVDGVTRNYQSVWGNTMNSGSNSAGAYFKGAVLDLNGIFLVIADTSMNMGSYTWTYTPGTAVIGGNWAAVKPSRPPVTGNDAFQFWPGGAVKWDGTCFLTGTLISTPSGHVAVEDIKPGMEVLAFDKSGNSVVKKIQWVGKEQVNRFHPAFYLEKAPIRIKKDAIAENVPFKDCLVTPEHCLFVNGCFVPARMLVNDKSIYSDRSLVEYEYFHVELEDHSILQSDGLFSESYLKTSKKGFSSFEGKASSEDKTWEHDAAAQLNVGRDFVEPLYQQFAQRAEELQFPAMERKIVSTSKIYMIDQEGNKVYASRVSGNKHLFHIKGGLDSVFIRSASSQPSESIGPFVDDRRELGLLIGEISLLTSHNIVQYTKHLEDGELSGWYEGVSNSTRWTNGNAQLVNLGMKDSHFISIEVLDQLPSIRRVGTIEDTTEMTAVA